jgi:hypothetical protein
MAVKKFNKKAVERLYAQATFGRDEPDYMVVSTPYGPVELTPKSITGKKLAIAYMEGMFRCLK